MFSSVFVVDIVIDVHCLCRPMMHRRDCHQSMWSWNGYGFDSDSGYFFVVIYVVVASHCQMAVSSCAL